MAGNIEFRGYSQMNGCRLEMSVPPNCLEERFRSERQKLVFQFEGNPERDPWFIYIHGECARHIKVKSRTALVFNARCLYNWTKRTQTGFTCAEKDLRTHHEQLPFKIDVLFVVPRLRLFLNPA